jgi:putative ABC transport system substrate-binding protein
LGGNGFELGHLLDGWPLPPKTIPQSHVAAFVQGLRQLGWTEGQNLRIDVRWNAGDAALARIYAAQLIGLTPDVILVASTKRSGTVPLPLTG